MKLPTIHLNGTSQQSLLEGYQRASEAIRLAVDALYDAMPNGRDYYPQGTGAFTVAACEHGARIEALQAVRREIEALVEHCMDPQQEVQP